MTKNNKVNVFYRNTVDNKIEIIRFENVMSDDDIRERFGEDIARIYLTEGDAFRRERNYIYCRRDANLGPGICTKEFFSDRIAYMKKCVKRLEEICKKADNEKFKKENVITI